LTVHVGANTLGWLGFVVGIGQKFVRDALGTGAQIAQPIHRVVNRSARFECQLNDLLVLKHFEFGQSEATLRRWWSGTLRKGRLHDGVIVQIRAVQVSGLSVMVFRGYSRRLCHHRREGLRAIW